eukprot:SAG11_NODE_13297_length_661_cov_1.080071_1_plen_39_part_10
MIDQRSHKKLFEQIPLALFRLRLKQETLVHQVDQAPHL